MRYCLILLLLLVGCTSSQTIEHTESGIARDNIIRFAWKFENRTGWGTGFFISHQGRDLLVTADHNLGISVDINASRGHLQLYSQRLEEVDVNILATHRFREIDVAIFEVESIPGGFEPLPVGNVSGGDRVEILGFPENKAPTSNPGEVVKIEIFTNAELISGMSGGPVISNGKVVGVNSHRTIVSDTNTQEVLFQAASHSSILDALHLLEGEWSVTPQTKGASKDGARH